MRLFLTKYRHSAGASSFLPQEMCSRNSIPLPTPKPLQLLVARLEFGMRVAKEPAAPPQPVIYGMFRIRDRGRMRSKKSEWQGCVAPLPKDAGTEFVEARGEPFAFPTGRCEMSSRHRVGRIRQGRAG